MRVPENRFRASQACRILGSPVAFNLAALLLERGSLPLSDLTREARRSKATVCHHLTRLRLAQIVRYETRSGETVYWIKHPREFRRLLDALEGFVQTAARARPEAT